MALSVKSNPVCGSCGHTNEAESRYTTICERCGAPINQQRLKVAKEAPSALLKCPDCSNDCSDKAIACPHCGRPLEKKSFWQADLGGVGWLLVGSFVLGYFLRPVGALLFIISIVLLVYRLIMAFLASRRQ